MNYKAMREAKGMTQVQACKAVGVSIKTWQNWELGGMNPSGESLQKLKEVFGKECREKW